MTHDTNTADERLVEQFADTVPEAHELAEPGYVAPSQVNVGDKVLFGERTQPLTVVHKHAGGALELEGPRGGTYTVQSKYSYLAYIPDIGPVDLVLTHKAKPTYDVSVTADELRALAELRAEDD